MSRRLVITNGDWTTRHELGPTAIVIGRDPNCDLFFVNQKLSRRHARIEPGPDGVRLVDLGSRNGVWVNERRIDQRLLVPGDSIRLGGLRIVFEEERTDPGWRMETADTTVLQGVDATLALVGETPAAPASPTIEESPEATALLSRPPTETVPQVDDDATAVLRDVPSEISPGVHSEEVAEAILIPEPESFLRELWERTMDRWTALSWILRFSGIVFGVTTLLGVLWVILVPSGSVVGVVLGLLLACLVAYLAMVAARRLLVDPVARLGRDLDRLQDGETLSADRGYPELDELAKRVNRWAGGGSHAAKED